MEARLFVVGMKWFGHVDGSDKEEELFDENLTVAAIAAVRTAKVSTTPVCTSANGTVTHCTITRGVVLSVTPDRAIDIIARQ